MKAGVLFCCVLAVLFSLPVAAFGQGEEAPPTLEQIFADIGEMLSSVDPAQAAALKARLAETDDEIRHLENLQAALHNGILVEIPDVLRERLEIEPSESVLEDEQQKLRDLEKQKQLLETRLARRRAARRLPGEMARSTAGTRLAEAALEVELALPEPSKTRDLMPPAAEAADPVDPVRYGQALYLAGDYLGAIHAFERLDEAQRTPEIRYRLARSYELLGRWPEAKELYGTVAEADVEGHWGRQARWMLQLGESKTRIRSLLTAEKGKGKE